MRYSDAVPGRRLRGCRAESSHRRAISRPGRRPARQISRPVRAARSPPPLQHFQYLLHHRTAAGILRNVIVYDDGQPMPPASCRPLDADAPPAPLLPRELSNGAIRADSHAILLLLDLPAIAARGLTWIEIADAIQRMDAGQQVYLYLLAGMSL